MVREKADRFLFVALLALAVYPVLVGARRLDDNSLTSWRWVLAVYSPGKVFILNAFGIAGAYLFARAAPPSRIPGLFLFFAAALAGSFFWSVPEVVIDSSRYFTQAKHLAVYGTGHFFREWGGKVDAWTDLPLIPFIYGSIFRYLGESRIYIQVFCTVLFALTTVLTYLTGKELWDEEAGEAAALFMLGMPYLYSQVPLMLTDLPAMSLLLFSLYCALRALANGGAWLPAASLALFLASLTKFSTWPLLAAGLPMTLLVAAGRAGLGPALRRAALILIGTALPLGLWALWKFDILVSQLRLLTSFQWTGLGWWQESYLSTFFFQVHPFVTVFALFSIGLALKRRSLPALLPLALILVMIFLKVQRARYMLVIFPMLALAGGYGLRETAGAQLRRFIAGSAVAFSLIVSIFFYRPFLQTVSLANLKESAALLESLGISKVVVYTPFPEKPRINPAIAVPLFDIYYSGELIHDQGGQPAIPEEAARQSSFRFSWRYRSPGYYDPPESEDLSGKAVVVISGEKNPPLGPSLKKRLQGYRRHDFDKASELFRYRTLVSVYSPSGGT